MKYSTELPGLNGLTATKDEIEDCKKNHKILRISIALSNVCNLKCPYCYSSSGKKDKNELNLDEIFNIVDSAKKNGAKTITLVGGEPLIYPYIKEIVKYIHKHKLIPLIFTNGFALNEKLARFLFKNECSIILKYNSYDDPKLQDKMVGNVKGTFEKIQRSLKLLIKLGFNKSKPTRLAIESVIVKDNLSQIKKIFVFARKNNIYPYLELITPSGRGINYSGILTKEQSKKIFYDLLKIDEKQFGYTWIPRPPQVASTCKYYFVAIYVNYNGYVFPCPSVKIKLGNLRTNTLKEILNNPKTIKLKNICDNIKGKCKICKYNYECYGCRGTIYNLKKDIFASDPNCWLS